ncbi:hypothetical protein HOLleu_13841 [Holothuria leucospilota]|uniref:Uncharacterized protein n=1 Tax=Holothuria leucospilota TaxID=206669 RepID=A0A9Q1C7D5_HOLLE|nr:hypothetical protein HOLleu_13841 [Holothuria leucospilota]
MEPIQLRQDEFASVINLSECSLSKPQLRVLSKGLNFTPLPSSVDRFSLRESVANFERSLRLTEFFHDSKETDNSDYDSKLIKFRAKSTWTPPANRDKYLDSFIAVVTSEIMSAPEHKAFGNLSSDEHRAMRDLKYNFNVVIRQADKGSAVVIMDRCRYIQEGYRLLNDTSVYQRTEATTINDIERDIRQLADRLHDDDVITDDMHQYAIREGTRPARFYLLPKVHKKGVPGRPVISACGSATEGLSEIVDFFLQPYLSTIPSFIKDTDDFIRKIRDINVIPPGAFLVTIDVVALYPSIPHTNGLRALGDFLRECQLSTKVISGILKMSELVLFKNVFEFNSEYFLQMSGTAIGTKMAPAYGNIFMSVFERDLLSGSCNQPYVWLRYIDDVFVIWTHGEAKLNEFLSYINSFNPSIQFTWEYARDCVNFLDVSISVDTGGTITADLYVKPTDTHQYLLASSCHPNHTKRSIPYSQALRILRICSNLETARLRCSELADSLVKRGYNRNKVNSQIERAITNFSNPTSMRESYSTRPVFFNVQFHPSLPDIRGILQRYMPLLHQSDTMKTAVPTLPIISFSQPPNLSKTLCRAKLRQPAGGNDRASKPPRICGKKRCKLCSSLICSAHITSTANNKTFKCFNRDTSCDSQWVVYVIQCPVCNLQYVGQSNNFRSRMNGHKSDFRLYAAGKLSKMDNKLLYDHLIHHNLDYFHVYIVDYVHVANSSRQQLHQLLNRKERKWIWDLSSTAPYGLNQDDGYFSQNKRCRLY